MHVHMHMHMCMCACACACMCCCVVHVTCSCCTSFLPYLVTYFLSGTYYTGLARGDGFFRPKLMTRANAPTLTWGGRCWLAAGKA